MGKRKLPNFPGALFHVILEACRDESLMEDEKDWDALGSVLKRMLFWCGGSVQAARCRGHKLQLAIKLERAPLGAMCQRISAGYAQHLADNRRWYGQVFKQYYAHPIDSALYGTDLVLWLHTRLKQLGTTQTPKQRLWTAQDAYLGPNMLPWITTKDVLGELGHGVGALQAYRQRMMAGVAPEVLALLEHDVRRARRQGRAKASLEPPPKKRIVIPVPSVERVARLVATHRRVEYERMRSKSRERDVSKARIATGVLIVRNGGTLATVARLFELDSSTLIEGTERYRATEPELFVNAEMAVQPILNADR